MSTTINGIIFTYDAIAYPVTDSYSFSREPVAGAAFQKTFKGPRQDASLEIEIPVIAEDPWPDVEKLLGLVNQNEVLLIESSDQNIFGSQKAVYFKSESVKQDPEPGMPTLVRVSISGSVVGIPQTSGGMASKAFFYGGELKPTAIDVIYWSIQNASRKGKRPSSSIVPGVTWEQTTTSDWVDTSGTWTIKKDVGGYWVVQQQDDSTVAPDPISIYNGTDNDASNNLISIGTFQAMIKFRDNATAGLLFRMEGTSQTSTGLRATMFNNLIRLENRIGSNSYTVEASATFDFVDSQWYQIAIEGSNGNTNGSNKIRVFIDGKLYLEGTDNGIVSGRVGLSSKFDDPLLKPEFRELLVTRQLSPRTPTSVLHSNSGRPVIGENIDTEFLMGTSKVPAIRSYKNRVVAFTEE